MDDAVAFRQSIQLPVAGGTIQVNLAISLLGLQRIEQMGLVRAAAWERARVRAAQAIAALQPQPGEQFVFTFTGSPDDRAFRAQRAE